MRIIRRFFLVAVVLGASACGAQTEQDARPDTRSSPAATSGVREETTAVDTKSGAETIGTTKRGKRAAVDGELNVALISAAGRGDAEAVGRLLERGASVEARDASGRTALVAAAYGNNLETARLLVGAGADVNAKDETQQSAYLIATSEVGDDPRLLELALRNGANVRSLDSYNGTGLIRAAERGYVEIVRRLLETDIAVDHVNNLGWTALLEAIILGNGGPSHTEVVRLLVQEGGAAPNLADGEGVTPHNHARARDYAGIVRILEDAGAR